MFADLGHFHFPVRAIQTAFTCIVFPCLLLAYMGQDAYLLKNPTSYSNIFYDSVPGIITGFGRHLPVTISLSCSTRESELLVLVRIFWYWCILVVKIEMGLMQKSLLEHNMQKDLMQKSLNDILVFNDPTALTEEELYDLRDRWATCFLQLYNPEVDYDDAGEKD
ncbi:unnamed protein product [Trifolium pratense]|uniref:Uncharacterized protein n=1 Tax=Trifolium pratense TaxID=57577 RepID=A0ACB0JKK5_TRIPR|nr:unnamed protein product [Trifolium pratense]